MRLDVVECRKAEQLLESVNGTLVDGDEAGEGEEVSDFRIVKFDMAESR